MSQLAQHLHVIGHALIDTFGLQRFAFLFEELHLLAQVVLYLADGAQGAFLGGHEEVGGINLVRVEAPHADPAHRVYLFDAVYLVSPENHPQQVVAVGQVDVHRVALHAEVAARQVQVVAHVQTVHQPTQEHVAVERLARNDLDDVLVKVGGITHAVDARDGTDHDDILPPAEQGRRGR